MGCDAIADVRDTIQQFRAYDGSDGWVDEWNREVVKPATALKMGISPVISDGFGFAMGVFYYGSLAGSYIALCVGIAHFVSEKDRSQAAYDLFIAAAEGVMAIVLGFVVVAKLHERFKTLRHMMNQFRLDHVDADLHLTALEKALNADDGIGLVVFPFDTVFDHATVQGHIQFLAQIVAVVVPFVLSNMAASGSEGEYDSEFCDLAQRVCSGRADGNAAVVGAQATLTPACFPTAAQSALAAQLLATANASGVFRDSSCVWAVDFRRGSWDGPAALAMPAGLC